MINETKLLVEIQENLSFSRNEFFSNNDQFHRKCHACEIVN